MHRLFFATTLRGAWRINFKLYAKALNKAKKGEILLNKFDSKIKLLSKKAGKKLHKKLSIIRFLPGQTRIYMKNSFSGNILDQIGFHRTASQDKDLFAEQISKEQISKADGDVIFYFTYNKKNTQSSQREKAWLNDPLFKDLKAVKANKVFEVSDAIWNTSGGILSANLMLLDLEKFLSNL